MPLCQSVRPMMPDRSRSSPRSAAYLRRSQIAIGVGVVASFGLILILAQVLHHDPSRWSPHDSALLAFLGLVFMSVLAVVIGIVASAFVLWRHRELRDRRSLGMLGAGVVWVSVFVFSAAHPPSYFLG